YTYQDAGRFRFASEIKALLADPQVDARLNPEALSEHLAFRYLTGDETLFAGIRKLPPGHTLTIALGRAGDGARITLRRYWDVPAPAAPAALSSRLSALGWEGPALAESRALRAENASEASIVERFRALFEEVVRLRLMSDVPLGMFLSGGIDS